MARQRNSLDSARKWISIKNEILRREISDSCGGKSSAHKCAPRVARGFKDPQSIQQASHIALDLASRIL